MSKSLVVGAATLMAVSCGAALLAGDIAQNAKAQGKAQAALAASLFVSPEEKLRIAALHDTLFTLDSHVDIPADYTLTPASDPGVLTALQVDLPKMDQGQLDGAFFIVYVKQDVRDAAGYAKAYKAAMTKFDAIHRMTEHLYPADISLAYHPEDVERIQAEGRKVALIGIENGFVIGTDLSLLQTYYDLGARYMTLAHVGHNDIADSSMPKTNLGDSVSEHGGISAFGRNVIGEMNRLGMMVDVSHISTDAMMQAVALSQAPVIASHSATKELRVHPRNMTDAQMSALADAGGVMQVVAFSSYLVSNPLREQAVFAARTKLANAQPSGTLDFSQPRVVAAYRAAMAELSEVYPPASVSDFVDHIDHAVKIMGVDHVGIASDFDGGGGVLGWQNASESGAVTAELVRRGYSDHDIALIWGGNLLRVWGEIEEVARALQEDAG
jgi:membrane dipeptidase